MVKVKKSEEPKKKATKKVPEKESKVSSDVGKDDSEKKKKHRRVGIKSKFATPIKRLCKSLKIPQANRDAVHIIDDAVQKYLTGLTRHMSSMLANSNKKLTQKTARLAHIAYMDSLGASDDITKGALKRADAALNYLSESFGPAAPPAPRKKAVKK